MDYTESIKIINRLVLKYHSLSNQQPILVCFDQDGHVIPNQTVAAASPQQMQGPLSCFTPQAGVGHYCHLRSTTSNVDNQQRRSTGYILEAPAWSVTIMVEEVGSNIDVSTNRRGISPEMMRFFSQWAQR